MAKLLFISTNWSWGGSEELWLMSAKRFKEDGYEVVIRCPYEHPNIDNSGLQRIPFYEAKVKETIFERAIYKLKLSKRKDRGSFLKKQLVSEKPGLVIISQGNSVGSLYEMECCLQLRIPYITITQLVAEIHFFDLSPKNISRFQAAYQNAKKNYFVSKQNLQLNNIMLGVQLPNAETIYNPCKIKNQGLPIFPSIQPHYKIAMVGRLECYHKGYDLLLQVINNPKWRDRPIQFNLYGDGPHLELLQMNIKLYNLKNVFFQKHYDNVCDIWKENHVLLMASRIEGQSLSLIEAMWCKRPAVVTKVGGADELIEDGVNGFIAEAATLEALDDAMERAWQKRDAWQQMGENAAATIRNIHPQDEVYYLNNKITEQIS